MKIADVKSEALKSRGLGAGAGGDIRAQSFELGRARSEIAPKALETMTDFDDRL